MTKELAKASRPLEEEQPHVVPCTKGHVRELAIAATHEDGKRTTRCLCTGGGG
jgi:hypothetical protein